MYRALTDFFFFGETLIWMLGSLSCCSSKASNSAKACSAPFRVLSRKARWIPETEFHPSIRSSSCSLRLSIVLNVLIVLEDGLPTTCEIIIINIYIVNCIYVQYCFFNIALLCLHLMFSIVQYCSNFAVENCKTQF